MNPRIKKNAALTLPRVKVVDVAALKFRHGRMLSCADAFALHDARECARQNAEVEPQRPVVDVPDVELETWLPGEGIAPVDLRPTGDSWQDFQSPPLEL